MYVQQFTLCRRIGGLCLLPIAKWWAYSLHIAWGAPQLRQKKRRRLFENQQNYKIYKILKMKIDKNQ